MSGQWTVYILETANGSLYTGIAVDTGARFRVHAAGRGSRAVRMAGGPRRIVWRREGLTRGAALRLERAIKRLPRSAKERLVEDRPEAALLIPHPGLAGR